MSSHHIIREDQEPALLIADALVDFQRVQELLEWSPSVIVTEQALGSVLNWGIKIDVVVTQEENISNLTTALLDQSPVKFLSCRHEHEALSTALYFLIASKQKTVNIFSMEPLESFESFSSINISVFQTGKRWSFIRNGHYEKWFPVGRRIQVHPTNSQPDILTQVEGIVTIQRDKSFWVSED